MSFMPTGWDKNIDVNVISDRIREQTSVKTNRTDKNGAPDTSYMSKEEKDAWNNMVIRAESRQVSQQEIFDNIKIDFKSKRVPMPGEGSIFNPNMGNPGTFGQIGNQVNDIISGVPNALGNIAGNVMKDINDVGDSVKKLANGLFGGKSKSGKVLDPSGILKGGKGITDILGDLGGTDLVKQAKSIFTSGGKTLGATIDIYQNAGIAGAQNKLGSVLDSALGAANDIFGKALGDTLSKVSSGLDIVSNVMDPNTSKNILDGFKNNLLNGVPLNKDNIKDIVYKGIGYDGKSLDFSNGIKGLGDSIMEGVLNDIDGNTGIISFYKDAEVIIKGDGNGVDAVFKMLDNMSGNTKLGAYFNLGDELKLYNTVAKSLTNLGVDKKFEQLYDGISGNNKDKFISENIQEVVGINGDVDFLELALGKKSPDWIFSNYPNIIGDLGSSYVPPQTKEGFVDTQQYERLIAALKSLDKDWAMLDKDKGIYNLNLLANFNAEAKQAILIDGDRDLIAAMMLSAAYSGVYNTVGELQVRYPGFPIKGK